MIYINPIERKIMSDISSLMNKLHIVTNLYNFREIFSGIVDEIIFVLVLAILSLKCL